MSESIVIANSTIRQQDGLYCLTDLHRASGGKAKSQPSYFLRTQQTQDLVNKINHSANMQSAVRVINGGENRGTYVCKQLVIAYGAWVNPDFHLLVLNTFLDAAEPKQKPTLPATYLEALEALVETEKAKQAAEQKAAIAGGALQRLGSAQGSISIRAAAKSLKHPEKALVGRLLAMGYLYRLNGRLAAAQPYTKNGWFEHKYGDSDGKAFMQVLVTPLGMMKLAQKLEIAV